MNDDIRFQRILAHFTEGFELNSAQYLELNRAMNVAGKINKENLNRILTVMETGKSFTQAVKVISVGAYSSWLNKINETPEWKKLYLESKERSAESLLDMVYDLINEPPDINLNGKQATQKQKLNFDMLKWLCGVLNRRLYGDKYDLNLGGQEDNPVVTTITRTVIDPVESDE